MVQENGLNRGCWFEEMPPNLWDSREIPGVTICRACAPSGGHFLELHFPWEGERSGPEDPTSLPTPQGIWGLSPLLDGKLPSLTVSEEGFENHGHEAAPWGETLGTEAREMGRGAHSHSLSPFKRQQNTCFSLRLN